EEAGTNYSIKAGDSITLTCGDSSITLKPGGIVISGTQVTVQTATPVAAQNKIDETTYKANLKTWNSEWWTYYKDKAMRKNPAAMRPKPTPPVPAVGTAL